MRALEAALAGSEARKLDIENNIRLQELGIQQLEKALGETGDPDIRNSLNDARAQIEVARTNLRNAEAGIQTLRAQIAAERSKPRYGDDPTDPPAIVAPEQTTNT